MHCLLFQDSKKAQNCSKLACFGASDIQPGMQFEQADAAAHECTLSTFHIWLYAAGTRKGSFTPGYYATRPKYTTHA